MLTIEVEFLLGRCYSTDVSRRDAAEWPPHPARLFSALVNATFDSPVGGESSNEEIEALRFLEALNPPVVEASLATGRDVKTHFVPVNDTPKAANYLSVLPEMRLRKERFFPSVTPENPLVRFSWPDASPDASTFRTLAGLSARVAYLGHSSSLVRVSVSEATTSPSWVPAPGGNRVLRVAGKGQLDALRQAWQMHRGVHMRTLPCRHVAYATPEPTPKPVPSGCFGKHWPVLRTLHGRENRPLSIKAAAVLTKALREALLAALGAPSSPVISGHEADGSPSRSPHLAFVALPDVGHLHAHAGVLGLALVPPVNLPDADERKLQRAIRSISRLYWDGGEVSVEHVTERQERAALRPETWCRPSRGWATVTPFVFDRFPKSGRWGEEAESIVGAACEYAGLPKPKRIAVVRISPVLGVPPVSDFPLMVRKASAPARLQSHVVIEFDEPVAGPVLIGAGRFFGYGLCRPVRNPFGEDQDDG